MTKKSIFTFLISFLFIFYLAGCGGAPEDIKKKILDRDPSFSRVIDEINSIQLEMDKEKNSYKDKTGEVDAEILLLDKKKEELKKIYMESLSKIKHKLDPMRNGVENQIKEISGLMESKKKELAAMDADIDQVNKMVGKKERLSLTSDEIQAWGKRLSSLIEIKSGLEKELNKFSEDIETLNLKLRVLNIK